MKRKCFITLVLSTFVFCTSLPLQARSLVPLSEDEWYTTVTEGGETTMVFVSGKNCKSCDAMKKLIEEAAEMRPDMVFYSMTNEQLPLPDEMLPFVIFSVAGQKTVVRGHGWRPDTVQDVMMFISQREAYAAREEAVLAALRGQSNKRKILEADSASAEEIAKVVREIDLLSTELQALRSNNKLNAFGKN